MTPIGDYVYAKKIERAVQGIYKPGKVSDTHQYYEVIAVGPGWDGIEHKIIAQVKPGDQVVIQAQAAEGDTPDDVSAQGYALFPHTRVMAILK